MYNDLNSRNSLFFGVFGIIESAPTLHPYLLGCVIQFEYRTPIGKGPEKGPINKGIEERNFLIYKLIEENSEISRAQMTQELGISEKKVRTSLKHLMDGGYIIHDGPAKGGNWNTISMTEGEAKRRFETLTEK